MQTKCFISLLIVVMSLGACNQEGESKANTDSDRVTATTAIPDFSVTDSVEVIYYPNPQNQKEYQTFFITDTAFIKALAGSLAAPPVQREPCPHHIKMYLFQKGNVYKTVYASMDAGCQYLAFAIGANPFYVPFTPQVGQVLDSVVSKLQ